MALTGTKTIFMRIWGGGAKFVWPHQFIYDRLQSLHTNNFQIDSESVLEFLNQNRVIEFPAQFDQLRHLDRMTRCAYDYICAGLKWTRRFDGAV